jgi:prolipoprotein diacylglyceryltransferase
MGSVGVSLLNAVLFIAILIGFCMPAAKIFARIIEKKMHTFTVGGASFFGMIIAPATVLIVNRSLAVPGDPIMVMLPFLTAAAISYAFGEGLGRLACISFGCCYGKPVKGTGPFVERLFERCSFTFSGKTKKIAYEAGLDGHKVIPVQAMTSVLFVMTGIVSVYLFLSAHYTVAYGLTMLVTQGWRFVSEAMRADFRGKGRFSMYQIMALLSCLYAFLLAVFLPEQGMGAPDVSRGLRYLWNHGVIVSIQALWAAMFVYFGRSRVTSSTISLFVDREKI